jgi:hypothetical protein
VKEEEIEKSMFLIRSKTRKNKTVMTIFLKANWENIIMANYEIDPKYYFLSYLKGGA